MRLRMPAGRRREMSETGEGTPPGTEGQAPTEEEMRAALEEQMRQVRVEDLLLQSVASIINLTARRIAKPDERDLGQAKTGIDAVTALAELLPEEASKQVRNALSELQVLYAQAAGGAEGEDGEEDPVAGMVPPAEGRARQGEVSRPRPRSPAGSRRPGSGSRASERSQGATTPLADKLPRRLTRVPAPGYPT